MEEKQKNSKIEAASTTTPKPLQKLEKEKIEKLKKTLKNNNTPKGSKVMGQNEVKSPKKSEITSQSDQRSTTWTFLVYPESAPNNWIEILKELHVPFVVSPLHNKDIKDRSTGELKKPHYHCVIKFRSKKSYKQVKTEICDRLNGPIPQPVVDFSMMIRYLVHMDDPDKYQYDKEDIRVYGNIDVKEYIYSKRDYQYEVLKDILDFCQKFNIQEYSTILNYAKDEKPLWLPYVSKTFRAAIDSYVRSQRYSSENGTY